MGYQWDKQKKSPGNKWKQTHNNPKPLGRSKSHPEREVYSITGLPQKQEKSQLNNLPLYLKELGKEQLEKLRVSTRKEIIKIRAEINDIETKTKPKPNIRSMKPRGSYLKR